MDKNSLKILLDEYEKNPIDFLLNVYILEEGLAGRIDDPATHEKLKNIKDYIYENRSYMPFINEQIINYKKDIEEERKNKTSSFMEKLKEAQKRT